MDPFDFGEDPGFLCQRGADGVGFPSEGERLPVGKIREPGESEGRTGQNGHERAKPAGGEPIPRNALGFPLSHLRARNALRPRTITRESKLGLEADYGHDSRNEKGNGYNRTSPKVFILSS